MWNSIIAIDIDTLIPARRKGVDGFSVETPGLLTDPVFHGVLHFLVTGEPLIFQKLFLRAEDMGVTRGDIGAVRRMLQDLPSKFFKKLEGLLGHMWPSVVLEKHYR
ncbi:hypothetical protein AVEN_141920-1 [Araneus ventricosus]|uniref:Uncharacterized protein n=1 Tax=Araneus ventricosus TaxID=182803 RepID=A0A4Y2PXV1_ARAVE|nr:hypothetical protein AVEN_141920-1 [Araneus ventricosus]